MMNSTVSPSSVIFIDSRMEIDTTQVAPGTQVIRIDPTEDGIATISEVLATHHDLASLQIIGHGSAGRLFLGNVELGNENLAQYEAQVRGWGSALAADGDLFLFGCNVAAGDIGKTFVHQIAELTQADVAASTDLTGNDALGGDWDLEYQVGSIESQSALSLNLLETFDGVLVGVADANELVNQINLGTSQIELTGNSFILSAPIYINSGQTVTIDGQGKTINGNGNQIFVINGGTLNLVNMSVTGGLARGGNGEGGGGGGLGAGGAIFMGSGTLTTDTVTFTGNQARGGDANGTGGAGGTAEQNGAGGGSGGGLNGAAGATGGVGGGVTDGDDPGSSGNLGDFGQGGGGGGGGGGEEADGNDVGGDGGAGGNGGWGAGGGGGGGGGNDTDDIPFTDGERGSGGAGSAGGQFGGAGEAGFEGNNENGGGNRIGGQGGGGAGVGGAIFVQSGNVVLVGSNFGGNSVAGGLGFENGQGAFADVYNIGGTVQQIDSNVGDSFGIGVLTTPKVRIEGVTPPNESGTNGSITLKLDRTLPAQVAVAYTLAGTATADTDYKLQYNGTDLNGSVSIPANTDTVTIEIVPTDDIIYDPGETIEFTLSDGQLYDLDTTIDRTIEIIDNEPVVGISAVSTIAEKDGAQEVFTISLDKPAPKTLTVPYTVSGTATAGNDDDFAPLSGQVTIPEGKTTAKIAIEAFDDAIEEGGSETIVLTLNDSGGNNYQVDNDHKEARTIVSDSNTVEEPSPSDKLILIQKTGARTFVVEGSNQPDQLQILLVKQPTKDVTLSFNTGDQLEPISDVTIPVADWDQPVTVDVYAKSDTIVEPKEVKVDINFTLTSDDAAFNGLEVPAREVTVRDREIDGNAFSNGLDKLLRKIDELIAQQLDSTKLPLIGSLGDYTPNFIESFRESLISELKSIGMETSSTIADKIKTTIEQGLDKLGLDPDVKVNLSAGLEETTFDITIGSKSTKEADLSTDLGIPDLGLSVDGKANTGFEYKLDLGIGWHQDFGFFVDTDKTHFHADASVELNKDFNAQGNLGFLQLEAENNPADPTKAGIKFDVSLSDLDNVPTIQYLDANNNGLWDKNEPNVAQQADGKYPTLPVVGRFDINRNGKYDSSEGKIKTQDTPDDGDRLTLSELGRDFKLGDLFSPELEGQANLGMKLVTSANGSSTLPSFLVDLNVDWDTFSYKNGRFKNLKQPTVSFDNMQVDVGSFARNFAEPVFGKIDEVVKPMRPFIDFLKQDISFFSTLGIDSLFGKKLDQNGDGKKSLAEFIGVLPNSKVNILPFIDAIDRISSINNLLDRIATTEGNFKIDLGSYTVGLPNSSGGFSLPSLDDFFSFSLPNFSIDDFSKGLTDLFDSATDIDLSWPSGLSLGDFSGGLKKLFSQSGLRSTLNLDWSNLTLEDFAQKFATVGDFNLSLGSIIGSSGTNLQNFATGLDSLLSATPSEVAIDWSKFSLQDFALGLKAVLAGNAGRSFDLDLSEISLQEFTNRFEPLLTSGNLIPNLDNPNLRNFAQPKIAAPDIKSQTETFTTGSTKELLDSLKNGTFDFPILTNPMVAVDLLLGKPDVNLFTYDIPRLELSAGFNTSFIVFAPPTIRLGFGGNASIAADLAFGFDSKGAIEWSKQDFAPSKGYLPLDGFYLSDRANPDGTGADVKEIEAALGVYLELAAGLNIGVASLEGYARGGLQGTLGVDFRDTGESTGTSDGKLRALSEIGANITQPYQLFNLQGALTATAQIGIKGSLLGFEKTLYSKDFGPFTLATFEYGENGFTVATIFDGPVAGATVFFDANFNSIQDADEPYTLSKIDGSYELAIPLELYDSDGNGLIDLSEGQIVLVDGADTDTFQDQRIPFISSPQWQVASPLTMLALKLEKPDPAQVEAQIEQSLGLPSNFKLYEDSPLAGITANDSNAATVFRTQAQLQNLLILGSNTLGAEGDRKPAAIALINEIVRRVQAGESIDLTDDDQLQSIINNAGAALGAIPTDFDTAFNELVYLNQEIAKITGTGVVARNAIAQLIPYDIADGSYLNLLENPWVSLLRAAVPEPDTATAQGVVQNAFGLAGVDITSFNPIDEIAKGNLKGLEVYAKQVQINATLTQLADIIVGLDVENAETVVSDALVTSLKAGESFTNMGDSAKIAALLTQVAPSLPPSLVNSLAGIIAESNAKINQIVAQANPSSDLQSLRTQIASEQAIAQGIQSQLLQSVALGEITIDQFQSLLEFNSTFDLGITIERIIDGTDGDDTLVGDDRNEMITAFAGNDLVQTGGGDNIAYGNQGQDTLQGGTGIDILAAGRDDDLILTGDGYNYAFGNKGSDRIEGGADIDYIYGGQDNDVVLGHAGDDWLLGDLGDDIVDGGDGYDIVIGGQGLDSLQGGGGDDVIFGNIENDTLDGGIGNDTLAAGKQDDWVLGNAGDDVLFGNIGNDFLDGGEGNDTIAAGQDNDQVFGNVGDDLLYGNIGNDLLDGGDGNDTIAGGQNDDQLFGNLGDDALFGNLGNDVLDAGDGNDYLAGGQNNDNLIGGLGDDTLSGDLGDDTLSGGGGSDRFAFAANGGNDIIADFTDGVDVISLSAELLAEIQSRQTIAVNTAEGARIELGGGSITLTGIDAAAIGVNDFVSLV
jgi:Ca2+-binding RTX toxin-like protein